MPDIDNAYLILLCQRCAKVLGWRVTEVKNRDAAEQKYVCIDCGKGFGLQ